MPFIKKTLSEEIMKRGKLRDKFLKYRTSENKKSFRYSEIILFHFSDKQTRNAMGILKKRR